MGSLALYVGLPLLFELLRLREAAGEHLRAEAPVDALLHHAGGKLRLHLGHRVLHQLPGSPRLRAGAGAEALAADGDAKYMPYTWEGCVVKIADNISYIGRDIEDAVTQGILKEKDIEKLDKLIGDIKNVNTTNIINYLVVDLCNNSNIEDGLKFSTKALDTMNLLIEFNNDKIYKHNILKPMVRYCTLFMNELFSLLKSAYDEDNTIRNLKKMKKFYPELISEFIGWLSNYCEIDERDEDKYQNRIIFDISKEKDYSKAIITYLSGMTDKYIVKMYDSLIEIL